MSDDSNLKIVVFLGIGAFAAFSMGILLVVLRILLIFFDELVIMGMTVIL